jgi:hypothetical protein
LLDIRSGGLGCLARGRTPTDSFVADGNPIGVFTIRASFHITYNDINGNGEADPGEITAKFDYLPIHCG